MTVNVFEYLWRNLRSIDSHFFIDFYVTDVTSSEKFATSKANTQMFTWF